MLRNGKSCLLATFTSIRRAAPAMLCSVVPSFAALAVPLLALAVLCSVVPSFAVLSGQRVSRAPCFEWSRCAEVRRLDVGDLLCVSDHPYL